MATQKTKLIIETEGGERTIVDLNKIAEAGDKAFTRIRDRAKEVPGHLKLVDATMREVQTRTEALTDRAGLLGKALTALGPGGQVVAAAAGGLAIVAGGLALAAKRTIEWGDALDEQSQRTGLSTTKLQELAFAARQTGVSQEALNSATEKLSKNVGEARRGTGALSSALKDTDRAFLDTVKSATSADQRLDLVLRRMASLKDETQQAALATAAFGKSGTILIPLARDYEALSKRAHELNLIVGEDQVQALGKANDRLAELGDTISGNLRVRIAEVAPEVERLAGFLVDVAAAGFQAADSLFNLGSPVEKLKRELLALEAALPQGGVAGAFVDDPSLGRIEQLRNQIAALEKQEKDASAAREKEREARAAAARAEAADTERRSAAADAAKKIASERTSVLKRFADDERRLTEAGLEGVELLQAKRVAAAAEADELLKRGVITQQEHDDRLLEEAARFFAEKGEIERKEAEKAAEKLAKEQEKLAAKAEKAFLAPFKNALENIQRDFGQMFASVLENGIETFDDVAGAARHIFAQLGGELASLLFQQQVTQPLLQIVATLAGGASSGGGGGGALGNLSSGASLVSTGASLLGGVVTLIPGAGTGGGTAIAVGGTVVGTAGGSSAFVGPGLATGASASGVGSGGAAGAGAGLGAGAAAGGIIAAVVGAIINGLISSKATARFPSGRVAPTTANKIAVSGTLPIVTDLLNVARGNYEDAFIGMIFPLWQQVQVALGLNDATRADFQGEVLRSVQGRLVERGVGGAGRFGRTPTGLGSGPGRFGAGLTPGSIAFGASVSALTGGGSRGAFAAGVAGAASRSGLDLQAAFEALGIGGPAAVKALNQVFDGGHQQVETYRKGVLGVVEVFTSLKEPAALRIANRLLEDGTAKGKEMRAVMQSLRASVSAVLQAAGQSGGDLDTFKASLAGVPAEAFASRATNALFGKGTELGGALTESLLATRLDFRRAHRRRSPGGKVVTPDEVSSIAADVAAAAEAMAGSLEAAGPSLTAYADAIKQITKATEDALGITEARRKLLNQDLGIEFIGFVDPKAAALLTLQRDQDARRKAFEEAGADMVLAEKVFAKERLQVIEQFDAEAKQKLEAAKATFSDFIDSITGGTSSPLSAATRISLSQRKFADLAAAARGGDAQALADLGGAGSDLLSAARDQFASSPGFFAIFRAVIDTAKSLGISVPGFASGGSFMVGGSGGTDRTLVAFRATRGERVTVTTPGQVGDAGALAAEVARLSHALAAANAQGNARLGALCDEISALRSRLDRLVNAPRVAA